VQQSQGPSIDREQSGSEQVKLGSSSLLDSDSITRCFLKADILEKASLNVVECQNILQTQKLTHQVYQEIIQEKLIGFEHLTCHLIDLLDITNQFLLCYLINGLIKLLILISCNKIFIVQVQSSQLELSRAKKSARSSQFPQSSQARARARMEVGEPSPSLARARCHH
jgi:hypothetical protein